MVKVPTFINNVFDTFPLVEYPPVNNTTEELRHDLEDQKVYFTQHEPKEKGSFILGVFNVCEYKGHTVPTDPISLGYTLILANKNGLGLPTPNAKGGHCIMKLAYNASPNKQLPILIEDESTRIIRCYDELAKLINKSLTTQQDKFIMGLVDTTIFDLWVLCLLVEKIELADIFGLRLSQITKYDLLNDIKAWNGFSVRYPKYPESLYHSKLEDFQLLLGLLKECNRTIQLKINAFIIHIQLFLKDTKLYPIVKNIHVNI